MYHLRNGDDTEKIAGKPGGNQAYSKIQRSSLLEYVLKLTEVIDDLKSSLFNRRFIINLSGRE
jgi:hypothetical protein